MTPHSQRRSALAGVIVAAVLLAGCAAHRYHDEGMELINAGKREQGVALLAQATQLEPNNARFRMDYMTQQGLVIRDLLDRADTARAAGQLSAARDLYVAAARIDAGNERARRGIVQTNLDERHATIIADAERLQKSGNSVAAREKLRVVLTENPVNNSALAL